MRNGLAHINEEFYRTKYIMYNTVGIDCYILKVSTPLTTPKHAPGVINYKASKMKHHAEHSFIEYPYYGMD